MSSENYFGKLSERLLSVGGMSYSGTIGYKPIEMTTRDPEDSDLEWNFYSEPRNSRLLKRYPPKLLDRAAEAAASDVNMKQEAWLEEKYLGVESYTNSCRLIAENRYGAAAVEAYEMDGEVFFTEYLADERGELDFTDDPERVAASNIPEDISFEDFFEDVCVKSDIIVVR